MNILKLMNVINILIDSTKKDNENDRQWINIKIVE